MTKWECPPTTCLAADVDEAMQTLYPRPEVDGEAGTVQRCQVEAAKDAARELAYAYREDELVQVFISGTTGTVSRNGRPALDVQVRVVEADDVPF